MAVFLKDFNHISMILISKNRFIKHSFWFMIINDPTTAKQLSELVDKLRERAFIWKMSFNHDPSKQDQEVIFAREIKNVVQPLIFFNEQPVD